MLGRGAALPGQDLDGPSPSGSVRAISPASAFRVKRRAGAALALGYPAIGGCRRSELMRDPTGLGAHPAEIVIFLGWPGPGPPPTRAYVQPLPSHGKPACCAPG